MNRRDRLLRSAQGQTPTAQRLCVQISAIVCAPGASRRAVARARWATPNRRCYFRDLSPKRESRSSTRGTFGFRCKSALLAAFTSTFTAPVRAEQADPQRWLARYTAEPGCPGEEAFREALESRLGRQPESALRQVRLTVELSRAPGAEATPAVEDASCEAVVHALTLVAALSGMGDDNAPPSRARATAGHKAPLGQAPRSPEDASRAPAPRRVDARPSIGGAVLAMMQSALAPRPASGWGPRSSGRGGRRFRPGCSSRWRPAVSGRFDGSLGSGGLGAHAAGDIDGDGIGDAFWSSVYPTQREFGVESDFADFFEPQWPTQHALLTYGSPSAAPSRELLRSNWALPSQRLSRPNAPAASTLARKVIPPLNK